ncbi:MAG: GlsB/YeaQ/YmgE family stress response membrane protein, partial [Silicimonas sp.]|nr:GlsB/YeaQ/YmgE family stress response membrane protein [Silicimonas sp.]
MEGFLEGLGVAALVLLAIIGALSGIIAGWIAGNRMGHYIVLGIVGAVALPFVLAALGVTALAAGGLLMLAVVALVGAVI